MNVTFLIPDGFASIDGVGVNNVDFTGLDPSIRVIQWKGDAGFLEFYPKGDFHPPNEAITTLAPYQIYVDQASGLIQSHLNPSVVWFTKDTWYKGQTYKKGSKFVSTSSPPEVPPDTTSQEPPTVYTGDFVLYWHDSSWILSGFPPTYTIQQAKLFLKRQVETNAAKLVNSQLRNCSLHKIQTTEDIASMYPADYLITHNYPTLGEFKEAVALVRDNIIRDIDFADDVTLLYRFNTQVRL